MILPSVASQALAFPLAPIRQLRWTETYLNEVVYGLAGLGLSSQAEYLPHRGRLSFFLLSALWQLLILATTVWIGACHINESFPVLWPVKVRCGRRRDPMLCRFRLDDCRFLWPQPMPRSW